MRRSRTSKSLAISRRRLEKFKGINPAPNLASGINISDFEAKIEEVAEIEASYNTSLSASDTILTVLKTKERELRDMRERMLTAVAFLYGKDTEQYVAAGGIRKSERKRALPRNISSAPNTNTGNEMPN